MTFENNLLTEPTQESSTIRESLSGSRLLRLTLQLQKLEEDETVTTYGREDSMYKSHLSLLQNTAKELGGFTFSQDDKKAKL